MTTQSEESYTAVLSMLDAGTLVSDQGVTCHSLDIETTTGIYRISVRNNQLLLRLDMRNYVYPPSFMALDDNLDTGEDVDFARFYQPDAPAPSDREVADELRELLRHHHRDTGRLSQHQWNLARDVMERGQADLVLVDTMEVRAVQPIQHLVVGQELHVVLMVRGLYADRDPWHLGSIVRLSPKK